MIRGYIDSASIHGVIAALGVPKIDQWPPWTRQSAIEVTSALINDPLFEIAPGPGSWAGDYGLMDHTMRSLAPIVSHSRPETSWEIQARNRVKSWAGRYPLIVKKAYEKVREDESYPGWLDWGSEDFLVEHSATLDGLFDPVFIPQLARILNCSENELQNVWKRSRDLKQVEQWARKRPDTDDFRLAIDAFVVAALLRGRYHDHIAEAANMQIIHHPIRHGILPKKKETTVFMLTNTEEYLTSIILAGALSEKKVKDRIAVWADNVIKARNAAKIGLIALSQKDSNSVAESLAMAAAKRLDLRTYSRLTAIRFEAMSSLIIGGLIYLVLCPWAGIPPGVDLIGLPVGLGVRAAIRHKTGRDLGDRIASLLSQRRARLHDLAEAVPGRIKGRWC